MIYRPAHTGWYAKLRHFFVDLGPGQEYKDAENPFGAVTNASHAGLAAAFEAEPQPVATR